MQEFNILSKNDAGVGNFLPQNIGSKWRDFLDPIISLKGKQMSKELEELQRANPDKEITAITVYFINGTLHVTKAFIGLCMGVSERSVTNWQKQGLVKSEYSLPRFNLYDWEYVLRWHRSTIDQKQSQRRRKRTF